MKATGIVRRIDELGRVVIPKEIRRTLRIREGDPLEIYTDRDGGVILRKYSPIGELSGFAKEYTESLVRALGNTAVICDKDQVISASGTARRELQDKSLRFRLFLFRKFIDSVDLFFRNHLKRPLPMHSLYTICTRFKSEI